MSWLNLRAVTSRRVDLALEHGGAPPYRVEITAPRALLEVRHSADPHRTQHYVGIEGAIHEALKLADVHYRQ